MKKITKTIISIIVILILTINYSVVFAEPPDMPGGGGSSQNGGTPPDKPEGEAPGGGNSSTSSNVSHTGATEISSSESSSNKTYSSSTDSQNALLVTGGESTITNPTVTKSGDSDGDNSDFYGTNAAVLVKAGTLNINGGNVTTNGSHANAVFAYADGTINISDTVIKTTSNNSGAIMVTGGGTLTANNVTAETDGNSSAPIRSDRGGGTLIVNGGTFTSNGTGSPAIYSTAEIIANNSTLISTASEGVVVEGKNSVTLNNVTLEATNTKLNGNSETYKGIFIYQSMSGDADVGTSSFTANNSTITNNKGDVIFVTNTNTVINLENNAILNNDTSGAFLRVSSAKWGTIGQNGGTVTLNCKNQKINGDIIVDSISTLDLSLKNGSIYKGTINGQNSAKTINVTLDSSSKLVLTGDTYITSLENEQEDNSNINLNGYTLYVNGEAITNTNFSGETDLVNEISSVENATKLIDAIKNNKLFPVALVLAIILVVVIIKKITKKNSEV